MPDRYAPEFGPSVPGWKTQLGRLAGTAQIAMSTTALGSGVLMGTVGPHMPFISAFSGVIGGAMMVAGLGGLVVGQCHAANALAAARVRQTREYEMVREYQSGVRQSARASGLRDPNLTFVPMPKHMRGVGIPDRPLGKIRFVRVSSVLALVGVATPTLIHAAHSAFQPHSNALFEYAQGMTIVGLSVGALQLSGDSLRLKWQKRVSEQNDYEQGR